MSLSLPEILTKIQHYCAYQERCHLEVRNKLYELGCSTDVVNEMVVQLIESNFLNEERFAKAYAGGKFRTMKWGRIKIVKELKFRKITDYCIKSALKEIDETDYINCLTQLVEKKIGKGCDWKMKQKITTWLLGRGFELHLIKDVIGTFA